MLTMSDVETITWRELTGNKFVRGIDPAMLTEQGLVKQAAIRKIGERQRTFFNIVYDREYLLEAIGRLICKPMFTIGKDKTIELIAEAWDNYYPNGKLKDARAERVEDANFAKV
jgi:hypothetical protein